MDQVRHDVVVNHFSCLWQHSSGFEIWREHSYEFVRYDMSSFEPELQCSFHPNLNAARIYVYAKLMFPWPVPSFGAQSRGVVWSELRHSCRWALSPNANNYQGCALVFYCSSIIPAKNEKCCRAFISEQPAGKNKTLVLNTPDIWAAHS